MFQGFMGFPWCSRGLQNRSRDISGNSKGFQGHSMEFQGDSKVFQLHFKGVNEFYVKILKKGILQDFRVVPRGFPLVF